MSFGHSRVNYKIIRRVRGEKDDDTDHDTHSLSCALERSAKRRRLIEQAERMVRTTYLGTMLVHPDDLRFQLPEDAPLWFGRKVVHKPQTLDRLVAAYGSDGPSRSVCASAIHV